MTKIIMVLTNHSQLGETGKQTGFWLEEFAAPYYVFLNAGVEITLASPQGGKPPLDPKSNDPDSQTDSTQRFKQDLKAQHQLANTLKLSEISAQDYDAIFYPGGHGPLWDLVENRESLALIEEMYQAGKPVAAVCHAPCVLINATNKNGFPLLKGKSVTGFSNSEETAIELTNVVPFLLEDELKRQGANYSCEADWQPYIIADGNLITGQNPASSEGVAQAVLEQLKTDN
jgi:putative intracellular protease/amidase